MLSRVVIFHHPQSEGAAALATQVARELDRRAIEAFAADAWHPDAAAHVPGSDLVVCIGGDGTVLRAARIVAEGAVPILGVNMGRLGFLTDLSPRDFFNHLERVVQADWRIEERIMVRADDESPDTGVVRTYHALNDIVVSRQSPGRPVYVELSIDGAQVAVYRCDGMIVATPTGSTGYSLSAGGPILAPTEHHLVVTPVSAHLALGRSLVLQPSSRVDLRITSDHGAVLSVDGQEDVPLVSGARVTVQISGYITRFVRFRDPSTFYGDLARKLEFQLSSVMNSSA